MHTQCICGHTAQSHLACVRKELLSPPELTTAPEFTWMASVPQQSHLQAAGKSSLSQLLPSTGFVCMPPLCYWLKQLLLKRVLKIPSGIRNLPLRDAFPPSWAKATRRGDSPMPSIPPAATATSPHWSYRSRPEAVTFFLQQVDAPQRQSDCCHFPGKSFKEGTKEKSKGHLYSRATQKLHCSGPALACLFGRQ